MNISLPLRAASLAALFSFCLIPALAKPPASVRGWLVHRPDAAYLETVVVAAKQHRINHLELSHDIVMQADEVTANPERTRLIESVARQAKQSGIKTYFWAHEINTRDKKANLDPQTTEGKAFWQARQDAYRRAFRACPSLDGVILMYGSSPFEVWDTPTLTEGDGWQRLTPVERIRFITRLIQDVCKAEGKELIVRDFNHGPEELRSLVDGLHNYEGITLLSKAEPQDFQPFYPHSFAVGGYGKSPQIIETDLCGEYWGQSVFLVSLAEYLPYRLKYAFEKGAIGAVGRADRGENAIIGTASECNLYFFDRVLDDPNVTPDTLYAEWFQKRYNLKSGSSEAKQLQTLFARTWPMAKKLYFTLGFWTWKSLSSVPENGSTIDGGLRGKSTAQWDNSAKPMEEKLLKPDSATVREIFAEKAEAVARAEANLTEVAGLKGKLSAIDFAQLETSFARAADVARLYEAIAQAYWRVRLRETTPDAPEAAKNECEKAILALGEWADLLEKKYASFRPIAGQGGRLRRLRDDLSQRLTKTTSASADGGSQTSRSTADG